jgi:regulator of sigma E protease
VTFAGLVPRLRVDTVRESSPSFGKALPGDVVLSISTSAGGGGHTAISNPSLKVFRQRLNDAGKAKAKVDLTVLRDGKPLTITGLTTTDISRDDSGLNVGVGMDEDHSVVADVQPDSAAQKAGIPAGATITEVDGQPVASWFDVEARLRQWLNAHPATAGAAPASVSVVYRTEGNMKKEADLALSPEEADAIRSNRYEAKIDMAQANTVRQTSNPLVAARWGVSETRDFILQFYLTLRRMTTGDVSAKNMMGPVGIFQAGTSFAAKGTDWLIWFLAMISANLAVVNFLPIPIVDGGLFTFLILEKVKGKPLSPKTQAIAQYVGMALLLGVFLFVTWQDVFNFRFRGMR